MSLQRRALVVGAGKRVEGAILPALLGFGGAIEVAGVWTRTSRKISFYDGDFTVQTETEPEAFDLASIDTVIVAVTRSQVPSVLRKLMRCDIGHVSLMLDTPVLDPKDLGTARLFPRFRKVVCTEDSIALPPIAAVKRLIDAGAVGHVRSIHLFHSGWRNHGLASLRYLTGMARPSRITVRRWNPKWSETRVRLGSVRASIVQPHIHGNGRVLVAGERGAIVDYAAGRDDAHEIGYRIEEGVYRGMTIRGEAIEDERDRLFFENLPRRGLPDPTLDNQFKIRGVMELIAGVNEEAGLAYRPWDAVYDHQCMRLAERLPAFVDVRLPGGRSLFGAGLRAASRFTRAGRKG
ncbi:MAG: hypothetical protein ACRDKG_11960 [Actinomycetota bacterium]